MTGIKIQNLQQTPVKHTENVRHKNSAEFGGVLKGAISRVANLEKETDWDVEYKFTIYDLANMMLEKDVNIMKIQKGIDVLRSDIAGPRYIIVYPVDSIKRPYDFYNLVINGISGEEIEKTIISVRR